MDLSSLQEHKNNVIEQDKLNEQRALEKQKESELKIKVVKQDIANICDSILKIQNDILTKIKNIDDDILQTILQDNYKLNENTIDFNFNLIVPYHLFYEYDRQFDELTCKDWFEHDDDFDDYNEFKKYLDTIPYEVKINFGLDESSSDCGIQLRSLYQNTDIFTSSVDVSNYQLSENFYYTHDSYYHQDNNDCSSCIGDKFTDFVKDALDQINIDTANKLYNNQNDTYFFSLCTVNNFMENVLNALIDRLELFNCVIISTKIEDYIHNSSNDDSMTFYIKIKNPLD